MYKIKVGISACLLGARVRYDGGHKRSVFCERELAEHFDFQPLCPEMAIGLGSPRPSIRLVRHDDEIRAEASNGRFDVTQQLQAFCEASVRQLDGLCGYILCAKSPTCGMERVKVYDGAKGATKTGVGLFARALMAAHPLLPVEEEGRLNDPILRENFVLRVFAYHEWQRLSAAGLSAASLIRFHSRYKYLALSHDPQSYRALGRLLGNLRERPVEGVADEYINLLMRTLARHASPRGHANVLQHLQGYFKRVLTPGQKQELTQVIQRYRTGLLPLLVPLTLIRHYLREYPNPYLAQQVYLNPYPEALKLRVSL